jgi:hypothetical protein
MPKSRCRFLIPVNYNDGRPIEAEKIVEIKIRLESAFGAFRWNEPQEGSWRGQVEFTHEVEIAINPRRVPELRALVCQIGRELGQKAMYFDASPPSVEIIDTETEEEEPDEDDLDKDKN